MSAALQRAINLVALTVGHVALNPVLTAGLLWILTKGPAGLREKLVSRIAALRDPVRYARIIKTLKVCLGLALAGRLNKQLNQIALNAWRIKSDKANWRWSQEIAVVTGGCSGIGALTVKRLISKGIKVSMSFLPIGKPHDRIAKLNSRLLFWTLAHYLPIYRAVRRNIMVFLCAQI